MGFKQIRTSDLSGKELDDNEVVTVVVKNEGKVFDASVEEMSALKRLRDVVVIELRHPSGQTETVLATKAEFAKVVPDEVLANADQSRGRRTGYRVNGSK